jgi:hypothetical protein
MKVRYLALQRRQGTTEVRDDAIAEVGDVGMDSRGCRFNHSAYALHLCVKQQILVDGCRDALSYLLNDEVERIHTLPMISHLGASGIFVGPQLLKALLSERQLIVEGGVAGGQPPHSNGTPILILYNLSNIPVSLIKNVRP